MKNKILALTILAFTSMNAMAQEEVNVTGKVVDKVGTPVSGAAVSVLGQPLTMVSTDVMGNFTISVSKDAQLWIQTPYDAKKVVKAEMDKKMTVKMIATDMDGTLLDGQGQLDLPRLDLY